MSVQFFYYSHPTHGGGMFGYTSKRTLSEFSRSAPGVSVEWTRPPRGVQAPATAGRAAAAYN